MSLCRRLSPRRLVNVCSSFHPPIQSRAYQLPSQSRTPPASKMEEPAPSALTPTPTPARPPLRYVDIGINLSDPVFAGVYHSKRHHRSDLPDIVARAAAVGCDKMMVTGSNIPESVRAIDIATQFPGTCFATVGVHPCSCLDFVKDPAGPDAHLSKLRDLAEKSLRAGTAVAFGEFGLDYDRLGLCPKPVQLEYFEKQLDLVVSLATPSTPPPPLFLHSRAAADDFVRLLKPRLGHLPKRGLVHSFTGTVEEMDELVGLGFDIGVNGCSMKTDENLEVIKAVPLERLQIETDGPWCEIRPSHASARYLPKEDKPVPQKQQQRKQKGQGRQTQGSTGEPDGTIPDIAATTDEPAPTLDVDVDADADPLPPPLPPSVKKERWVEGAMVKGRNEPATIPRVAYVIAKVKGVSVYEVAHRARENSIRMFRLGESVDAGSS